MDALIVTYPVEPGREVEHAEMCRQLAPAFAAAPGMVSATWLENARTGRAGAFFVFDGRESVSAFVASELFTLLGDGTEGSEKTTLEFDVNEPATAAGVGLGARSL